MLARSKNSLNLTPELLGLSNIKVVNVPTSATGREIIIEVKSTKEILPCRECGKPTKVSISWERNLY